MALWDLLRRNKKDAFQEYADNMQPLQPQRELPVIQIQEGQNGGAVYSPEQAQLQSQGQAQGAPRRGLRLIDRLLGVQAQPTDSIDTNTMNVTVSNNPRVGGLLNDIGAGARENFATGFAANNLLDNETADGRRKGFAYRLGEGLGTIGRVLESPLGRGLITAGIVGATGGDMLDALAYGGQAGTLNQRLRQQDRMFRNEMINNAQNSLRNSPEFNSLSNEEQRAIYNQLLTNPDGSLRDYNTMNDAEKRKFNTELQSAYANRLYQNQQEQLSNIANNINNMRGYVTDDVYNNFVKAQQLRDNADYRNMMANLQMENNRAMQDFRKDQAEYQRQKDAADRQDRALTRALTVRGQDLNYGLGMARLAADREKTEQGRPLSDSQVNTITQFDNALADTENIITKYKNSKYNGLFGVGGAIRRNPITSTFDPLATELKQDIDLLRKTIAKAKEGGRLTDQDERYYKKALFNPNLTRKQFIALAQKFYDSQQRQRNITLRNYGLQGKNTRNFEQNNNPLGLNL